MGRGIAHIPGVALFYYYVLLAGAAYRSWLFRDIALMLLIHQLQHQGTRLIPVDFLAAIHGRNPVGDRHRLLLANGIARSEALIRYLKQ